MKVKNLDKGEVVRIKSSYWKHNEYDVDTSFEGEELLVESWEVTETGDCIVDVRIFGIPFTQSITVENLKRVKV